MATATADNIQIIGGVDTHQDLHTAAVVSHDGTVLGTESFSTTRAGYRAMLRWFRSHGELLRVGVESTGTYGAGITRHLALSGIPVLEVTGPDPASRRAKGKDDALDAISAAEAARTRRRVQVAKDRSGTVEALRVLRTTRKTAIKCRRAALQQLHNTIVAAPEEVRDQVRNLTRMQRLRTCAAWRPDTVGYRDPVVATKLSLKSLARRILDINDEIAELDRFIVPLVEELAPSLLELEGVGTENAGAVMVAVGDNPEPHGPFEAVDPRFPQGFAAVGVDFKDRRVILRMLRQLPCDPVVMLHHRADRRLGLGDIHELVFSAPDPRQPFGG